MQSQAAKWYSLSAEQGNAGSLYVLGLCNAKGRGVAQDWEAAFGLFKGAAERDDVNGMFQTAWCYLNGKGAEGQDLEAAAYWCSLAVEGGHGSAGRMLAAIEVALEAAAVEAEALLPRQLDESDFDPQIWRDSLSEVLPRAEGGSAEDQRLIGFALGRRWSGAEPEWEEAVKWYRMAVEQDDPVAMFLLGVCYAKTRGVEQVRV